MNIVTGASLDVTPGLPSFTVNRYYDLIDEFLNQESDDFIQQAIRSTVLLSGRDWPLQRITLELHDPLDFDDAAVQRYVANLLMAATEQPAISELVEAELPPGIEACFHVTGSSYQHHFIGDLDGLADFYESISRYTRTEEIVTAVFTPACSDCSSHECHHDYPDFLVRYRKTTRQLIREDV